MAKRTVEEVAYVEKMMYGARLAERERCAKIADQLATGQAVEIYDRTLLLGSSTMTPVDAQEATAKAIAATIRQPV